MATLKRNTFLDGDDDDSDNGRDQNSEENERGRSDVAVRAAKRRKVQSTNQEQDDELSEDEQEALSNLPAHPQSDIDDLELEVKHQSSDNEASFPHLSTPALPAPKSVARAEKAARRSGVVYISRVPPFMKPHTLKHFLAPHAPKGIGRVFLTPEDHSSYLSRKKNGGNKKKSFTDGWVEFISKTEAKLAAETLNGNIIGGKKRGYYHDDIWNIKYLSGFKWSHLTEQISAENAEREARLREEIRKTRQENRTFLQDFERGKMLETMQSKSKARGEAVRNTEPARDFKQSKAKHSADRSKTVEHANVQKTLDMIF